ncbi:hypothetical protein X975_06207, partial [Stegodyphus mimosarum]
MCVINKFVQLLQLNTNIKQFARIWCQIIAIPSSSFPRMLYRKS